MIKGIIFDLDGTLISEREYILGCLENTGAYIDHAYGKRDAFKKLKALFEIKWERVFNRFFELEGISYDESEIQKLIKLYRDTMPAVKLYPDVMDTLDGLKRKSIKMALLTNGYYEVQKKKVELAGIDNYFDLIVIPDEFGRDKWKPNRWGYELILHKLDITPETIIAVGDMDHDFIVPNEMGMKCIYIEREDRMNALENKAVRKIRSLKEIEMEV